MPLTSADRAFGIIAVQRKILTPELLAAEEKLLEEKHQHGINVPLAQHLITAGKLDANQRSEIERIRAKHGRECEACPRTTYLLPGETPDTKPCEFCGGKLKVAASPVAMAAATSPLPPSTPAAAPRPPSSHGLGPRAGTGKPVEVAPLSSKITRAPMSMDVAEARSPRASPSTELGMSSTSREADLDAKGRDERARKLRMANAFGYEPPPAAPAPPPTGEITADELAPEAAPSPAAGAPPPMARAVLPPPPSPEEDPAPAFRRHTGPNFLPPDMLVPKAPIVPPLPFLDEARLILAFPFKPAILGVISVGAVIGAAIGGLNFFLSLLILFYFWAWQIKITDHVTSGKVDSIPDFPDPTDLLGTAWRVLLYNVACFLPLVLVVFLGSGLMSATAPAMPGGGRGGPEAKITMGDAHRRAGPGTRAVGNDVSDEEFFDAKDASVKLSTFKGKWLVLGLIDTDTTDDAGGTKGITSAQIFDLDRLARADKDCVVAAVIIDPGQRRMKALGLIKPDAPPRKERAREGDDEVPERSRLPDDINAGAIHGRSFGVPDELKVVKVLRTQDFKMPDKLGGTRIYPAVWIIDPAGKVRVYWDSGASDNVIYGTLSDLRRGGSGSGRSRALPGEASAAIGEWGALIATFGLLFVFVLLAGLFAYAYHPMAFLMTVVFTNGSLPFNYFAGVGSILKVRGEYLKLIAILIAVGIFGAIISFVVGDIGLAPAPVLVQYFVSGVLSRWVFLYTLVAEAYAVGRFYLRNKQALGWFD